MRLATRNIRKLRIIIALISTASNIAKMMVHIVIELWAKVKIDISIFPEAPGFGPQSPPRIEFDSRLETLTSGAVYCSGVGHLSLRAFTGNYLEYGGNHLSMQQAISEFEFIQ